MSQDLTPTALVVIGISGDLSRRKLLPALAEICRNSDIRAHLKILGLSRRTISKEDILTANSRNLSGQLEIMRMDYDSEAAYDELKQKLAGLECRQVIFYFAVPPESTRKIISHLGRAGMNTARFKLLMEKPFGTDYDSAAELISETSRHFKEEQVYRIDHFLAKEMAQNIAVFLGSNVIFRDVWSREFIERIEVVAEESIGIEGRAHFYEQTGALRDIVQSHLLQLTALTLMEPCPDVFDISMMRKRRLAALQRLKARPTSFIKGQYDGYAEDVKNPDSDVETFAAIELISGDPKWKNVPIKLITGKKLKEKLTEIRIYFKKAQSAQANLLRLRVQPREGIELELWVKKPGYEQELQLLPLDFSYQRHFDKLPDAYEQVIVDAIRGRANLFASSEEVLASWKILQPLLDNWQHYPLKSYRPGSPASALLPSAAEI